MDTQDQAFKTAREGLAKAGDDGDRKGIIEAGRRQGKRLRFDGPDY